MNTKILRYFLPALGAALLLSCTEKEPVPAGPMGGEACVPATVSLNLTLSGEENGTPSKLCEQMLAVSMTAQALMPKNPAKPPANMNMSRSIDSC